MQDRTEELFNASSHGIAALLSVVALVFMVIFSVKFGTAITVVACSIYGVTLIILYTASTLYHIVQYPPYKKFFKIIDHSSIYLLIAGTYTPFTLITLHGTWGWSLFGVVWGLALAGLFFKFFFTGRFKYLSTITYLAMGWLALVAVKPLIEALPTGGIWLLFIGGLFYTAGVAFYATDHKVRFRHFIWHLFVLAGSLCHFFSIFFYVILPLKN